MNPEADKGFIEEFAPPPQVPSVYRLLVYSSAVVISAVAGCGHAALIPSPTTAARCYALSFGAWSGNARSLDFYLPLPTHVALHDSLVMHDGSSSLRWAMRWPIDSLRRRASWEPAVNGDSLAVHFPSWWSTGVAIALPARGDTLRGRAFIYVDFEPYTPPRTTVTAVRIECPAELAVLAPPVG